MAKKKRETVRERSPGKEPKELPRTERNESNMFELNVPSSIERIQVKIKDQKF